MGCLGSSFYYFLFESCISSYFNYVLEILFTKLFVGKIRNLGL